MTILIARNPDNSIGSYLGPYINTKELKVNGVSPLHRPPRRRGLSEPFRAYVL